MSDPPELVGARFSLELREPGSADKGAEETQGHDGPWLGADGAPKLLEGGLNTAIHIVRDFVED